MSPIAPRSQDHQAFARHSKFGTSQVPKDMNNTKKSAADAATVATKFAAKVVAKKAAEQAAAEQAEVKAKRAVAVADKATKEEATKELAEQMMSAEEATPAKATKEQAPVIIWPAASPVTVPHRPARLRPIATAGLCFEGSGRNPPLPGQIHLWL